MINYEKIPGNIANGLKLYVEHRIKPGHFLTAVLENNLSQAINRADSESLSNLKEIVCFVYNDLPGTCWGSPDKVRGWLQ